MGKFRFFRRHSFVQLYVDFAPIFNQSVRTVNIIIASSYPTSATTTLLLLLYTVPATILYSECTSLMLCYCFCSCSSCNGPHPQPGGGSAMYAAQICSPMCAYASGPL